MSCLIFTTDLQPYFRGSFLLRIAQSVFCESSGDAQVLKFGFDCYIGDERNVAQFIQKGDDIDVAHDLIIHHPDITRLPVYTRIQPGLGLPLGSQAHLVDDIYAFRIGLEIKTFLNQFNDCVSILGRIICLQTTGGSQRNLRHTQEL